MTLRSERGLTLIEVLTTACIVGLVLVAVVSGLVSSLGPLMSSRENSALTSVLRAAVEEARAAGYASLAIGTTVNAGVWPGYDLLRTVSYVPGMTDRQGNPVVKYVELSLHRSPAAHNPTPAMSVGFLMCQGGP